jgi:hypothetical protein
MSLSNLSSFSFLVLCAVLAGCTGREDDRLPGPDETGPLAVTDLAAQPGNLEGTVELSWTAPADNGPDGRAESYEVRFSDSEITDTDFEGAAPFAQAWIPLGPGERETRTVTGLVSGVEYFFALRSVDAAGNLSAVSNSPSAPAAGDTVAPAALSDLTASPGGLPGSIVLAWTATGDNADAGCAASYEVRHSLSPITAQNFSAATEVAQSWQPLPSGRRESHLLKGLPPGVLHYFRVKVRDEVPNESPLSNPASAVPPASDTTPPAAVTDLAATMGSAPTQVSLSWTAPGDDGTAGGAAKSYVVKHALYPIDATNFDTVSTVCQSWTPLGPGSLETHVLDGYATGTAHYFALKARDDAGNLSGPSNAACFSLSWTDQNPALPAAVQTTTFHAVWGSSGSDVFVVGDNGTVVHFDGTAWSVMTTGVTASLRTVWGTSSSNVYAAGIGGQIIRYDGTSWQIVSAPWPPTNFTGIWGSSASKIYFSASEIWMPHDRTIDFYIYEFDGTSFQKTWHLTTWVYGLWGTSGTNVYAASPGGLAYDGSSWNGMNAPWGWSYGIWGRSGSDIYLTGSMGNILHFDGTSWSAESTGTNDWYRSVSGGSSFAIAVGNLGAAAIHDGTSWSPLVTGTTNALYGVWAGSGAIYAVGMNGTVLKFGG